MKNGHGTMFQEALAAYKPSKYPTAVAEFTALAEKGDAAAQNNLGNMYYSGLGVAQNDEKAIKWLRLAAEAGIIEAQYTLGCLYNFGRRPDDKKAKKWYSLAAEAGHIEARHDLGARYWLGPDKDIAQNHDEAKKWWRERAEAGDIKAQYKMGMMYLRGRGHFQDSAKAAKWFRLAAEAGHTEAQCHLGEMHGWLGEGAERDDVEAAKWYRHAAEAGHIQSQYILGFMYLEGEGVEQDIAEGMKWYRRAAEAGHAEAQHCIGIMYSGDLKKEYCLSYKWLTLAAAQGVDASNFRDNLVKKMMTPKQIAEAEKMVEQYLNSAAHGSSPEIPDN